MYYTSFCRLRSALATTNCVTTTVYPLQDAMIKAVDPFYRTVDGVSTSLLLISTKTLPYPVD